MRKIIVIIIVVLILITGGILGVKIISDSASKLNKEYKEAKKELKVNYDSLSKNVETYNEIRSTLAELMTSAAYYEDYPNVNEDLAQLYQEYDLLISGITVDIKKINESCLINYMEKEYIDICNNYPLIYEKIINVYVDDIASYNELITNYHNWASKDEYDLFKSNNINDYLDYNGDGIYEGRTNDGEE